MSSLESRLHANCHHAPAPRTLSRGYPRRRDQPLQKLVIAEAIRRYTSERLAQLAGPATKRPGLGESRLRQLAADLRLSAEEPVREAEETARATEGTGRARRHVIIAVDRYEDYLDWKRR